MWFNLRLWCLPTAVLAAYKMPNCQTLGWGHKSTQHGFFYRSKGLETLQTKITCTSIFTSWNSGDISQTKRKQTGSNISPASLWQMMQMPSFESWEGLCWKLQLRTNNPISHNCFGMWTRFLVGKTRESETQHLTTLWVHLYSSEFCRNCRPIVSSINMK